MVLFFFLRNNSPNFGGSGCMRVLNDKLYSFFERDVVYMVLARGILFFRIQRILKQGPWLPLPMTTYKKFYSREEGQTLLHSSSELGAHSIPWSIAIAGVGERSPSLCLLALAAFSGT